VVKIDGPCTKSFVKNFLEFHASRTVCREYLMHKKHELEEKIENLKAAGECTEKAESELVTLFDELHDMYTDFSLYFTMMRALYNENNHKIAVENLNKMRAASSSAKDHLWDNEKIADQVQEDADKLINKTRHALMKRLYGDDEEIEPCDNCGENHDQEDEDEDEDESEA